ncbi:MAG TPA: PIG-L family deacetylase [Elusimicrobiota bacterium]|nr:PIG-L family deacetylase [Elusimicrobiota bacterium]
MNRPICFLLSLAVAIMGPADAALPSTELPADVTPFSAHDRVLILAPHPDDEVLGCAGIIQKAVAAKAPVRIVFLTYGDNNEWSFTVYRHKPVLAPASMRQMGKIRRDEALAAAAVLGLSPDHLTFLGYPDFGTLAIWNDHWNTDPPYRSMLTRVTAVPYSTAYRPGASYKGDDILSDLEAVLTQYRPTRVFVSHPADHNPDHRALYLFLRVALWDLAKQMSPRVYPYLIHYVGWPRPRGYYPADALSPPDLFQDEITWQISPLSPAERVKKFEALQKHYTQYLYSGAYLASFCRTNELFGDFPVTTLVSETKDEPLVSEHLTDAERAEFVGLEERDADMKAGFLVLRVRLSRPMGETVETWMSAFGYRRDRPFAVMPKLNIQFGNIHHRLYDRGKRILDPRVRMIRHPRELIVEIPLDLLGQPERILTSSRTTLGRVPLDWMSWRVLDVPAEAKISPAAPLRNR